MNAAHGDEGHSHHNHHHHHPCSVSPPTPITRPNAILYRHPSTADPRSTREKKVTITHCGHTAQTIQVPLTRIQVPLTIQLPLPRIIPLLLSLPSLLSTGMNPVGAAKGSCSAVMMMPPRCTASPASQPASHCCCCCIVLTGTHPPTH